MPGLERYQRLVANPFLAMAGLAWWFAACLAVMSTEKSGWWLVICLSGTVIAFLPQYHCRDCGATGWLGRWREHQCEAVRVRIAALMPRIYRGPTPNEQTALWVLATLLALALILFLTGALG